MKEIFNNIAIWLKLLFEAAFGWQKEEIQWKDNLLVDDKEKKVPFHYLEQKSALEMSGQTDLLSKDCLKSEPKARKPRKPKATATDSKTTKKVSGKSAEKKPTETKPKTTRKRRPIPVED